MAVLYLAIEIDNKQFNRIIRFATKSVGANSNLEVKNNIDQILSRLYEPNEFIRLKCQTYYIDLTLKKFLAQGDSLIIIFDKIIDYNRNKFIPNEKS